jgi:arsenite-transporting ATPase
VIDPNNPTSVNSALRYWGCTIQAGAQVSGAFGISSQQPKLESFESAKKDLSPLSSAFISSPLMNSPIDWSRVLLDTMNEDARHLLTSLSSQSSNMTSSVKFDVESKSVTLFMPGFDKSEIKLYQVCNILLLISFLFDNFLYNFILHGTPFGIFYEK